MSSGAVTLGRSLIQESNAYVLWDCNVNSVYAQKTLKSWTIVVIGPGFASIGLMWTNDVSGKKKSVYVARQSVLSVL